MAHTVTCYEWDRIEGLEEEQRVALEAWRDKYNKNTSGDEDAASIIQFGSDYVTFTKYVGIIAFKDGLVLEVLPKLFRKDRERKINVKEEIEKQDIARAQKPDETSDTDNCVESKYAKSLLLTMLQRCKKISYKFFQKAKINIAQMPLLEIFIRMFIDEVRELIRRGIRCGYETVECNAPYFKGKLLVSQHIRYNVAHQERCYVQYDEFSVNRLENRLIKATCEFLVRMSSDGRNRTELRKILDLFDEVDASVDFRSDISQYTRDRNLTEYDNLMIWCRLFMEHRGFSNYSGNSIAFALMYPMEKVYEEYIACCLRDAFPDWTVTAQEQNKYLLTIDNKSMFQLKPDIVLRNRNGKYWILDTKWKILDDKQTNYGISQSDMYQMYAYYHRYRVDDQRIQGVILLYPCELYPCEEDKCRVFKENAVNGAEIYACYVKLGGCENSQDEIHDNVKKELKKLPCFK